jgi:putative ABC transport system permease protein
MDLLHDVRVTIRNLLEARGYTFAAVVTLALAMGATSAIFSAVHAVLLSPMPIADPERLIVAWGASSARDRNVIELSFRNVEDLAAGTQSLAGVAAIGSSNWSMVWETDGDPVRIPFAGVSASFFDTLGARPLLGRTFRPEDDAPNGPRVVVLNHGAWVRRFGANPHVVGSTMTLDEELYTVIGVMPNGFDFPRGAELWAPVVPILAGSSGQWKQDALTNVGVLFVVGRLREGVTPAAASQELSRLATTTPRFGSTVVVTPFLDYLLGPVRPALWLLFAAVAVLLLIACANVSALMLTRVTARQREHALRLALGATRGGLGRLWMLESVVLAVAGGTLGIIASHWIAAAIVALSPDDVPRVTDIAINVPVAVFTFAAILLTTLICGIAPVRLAGRTQLSEALADAARGTPGRHSRRTRSLLLIFQMGLAVVLLVSAGLVLRSFVNLRQLDLGFDPSQTLAIDVDPRGIDTPVNEWFDRLLQQVSSLPHVEAAGAIYLRPLALGAIGQGTLILLEGQPDTPEGKRGNPTLNYQVATPGYFDAMRIRLLRGRLFDARDTSRSERVAIVDETTARRLWPGDDPIGKRLGMPTFTPGERVTVWRTIVGVVADVRYRGLDDAWLDVYDAALQASLPANTLAIRTSGDPLSMATTVQARARELDPRVVVDGITTMDAVVSRAIAPWRLSAWMLALFAGLAFLLATVGLFSLVSLDVASRRHEFAVRLAVGALGRDILRAVLATTSLQVIAGLGLGVIAAVAATRALQTMLFGIEWIDVATYAAVLCLVLITVSIAAYLPARRASRIDPLALLRRD